MANSVVSVANLINGGGALAATTLTTASTTPGSLKLELLLIKSRTAIATNPNQPTVTGCGLTWVAVDSFVCDNAGTSRQRATIFRSMGLNPSTGTLTVDFGGQTQTHAGYILDELSGVDTSGSSGSGAVVQELNNFYDSAHALTGSITATLAAFSNPNNATYGAFGNGNSTTTLTDGSGFNTVTDFTDVAGGSMELRTEFQSSNNTSVAMSFSPNDIELGIFAFEIKAGNSGLFNNYQFPSAGNGISVTEKIR